jgi:hypothetical protein
METPMPEFTVGELMETLQKHPEDTEVTFGSSTYSKRPLIFYRFKQRGPNLLSIELSEVGDGDEPKLEIDNRITVGEIIKELKQRESTDLVDFGCTIDAVPLELRSVTNVVSFNLQQGEPPDWRYVKQDWK